MKRPRCPLARADVAKLRRAAEAFDGRPDDLHFEWSDRRIFCSELVCESYYRALGIKPGERQKLREFDLDAAAVRAKMHERYDPDMPLNEPVISPGAQFDSVEPMTVENR